MSIREQQPEVAPKQAMELDAMSEAIDSALRQLDVAKGRERHLREQVDQLERRLLDKEKELSGLQHELRNRSELVGELQRTLSWRVTKPLRAFRRLLARP